jgi:hypothetical protein
MGATKQHIEAVLISPFARFGGGDIGLVLVVRRQQDNLSSEDCAAETGDARLDGLDGPESRLCYARLARRVERAQGEPRVGER